MCEYLLSCPTDNKTNPVCSATDKNPLKNAESLSSGGKFPTAHHKCPPKNSKLPINASSYPSNDVMCASDVMEARITSLPCDVLDLFQHVLLEISRGVEDSLVRAVFSLVHCASDGLFQCEVMHLLSDSDLTPPSPFDEKSE